MGVCVQGNAGIMGVIKIYCLRYLGGNLKHLAIEYVAEQLAAMQQTISYKLSSWQDCDGYLIDTEVAVALITSPKYWHGSNTDFYRSKQRLSLHIPAGQFASQ